jgi:hypothetical protein
MNKRTIAHVGMAYKQRIADGGPSTVLSYSLRSATMGSTLVARRAGK